MQVHDLSLSTESASPRVPRAEKRVSRVHHVGICVGRGKYSYLFKESVYLITSETVQFLREFRYTDFDC